ncbi:MAG: MORN repeat-containing protein [Flavobacteriia bacterium]
MRVYFSTLKLLQGPLLKICSILFILFWVKILNAQCQSGDCTNGFGIYEYPNGDVFKGNWSNGKQNGYGEHYWMTGDVFKGNYIDNQWSGQGTTLYSNGDVKIATYETGAEVNRISYSWGSQKPSTCTGDCYNGFGKKIYAKGEYEGSWRNGERNGQGKMTWSTGDSFEGNWENGNMKGYGVYVYGNGKKYEGEFINGLREGRGTMYFLNGQKYKGDWKQGLRTGQGEFFFKNGDYYNGEWLNAQMQGRGKYIYANGKIDEGIFENGKLITSLSVTNSTNQPNWKCAQGTFSRTEKKSVNGLPVWNENNGQFQYEETASSASETILRDLNRQGVIIKLTTDRCYYKDNGLSDFRILYYGSWDNKPANNTDSKPPSINNQNSNTVKETCNYSFVKPKFIVSLIDNRTKCCYCSSKYSQYGPGPSDNEFFRSETLDYLTDKLYQHLMSVNASEEHIQDDAIRLTQYMQTIYPSLIASIGNVDAAMILTTINYYKTLGAPSNLASINVNRDQYAITSKFCSPEHHDKCMESQSCKCK